MGGDAVIKSGVVSNREGYPLNSVFGLKYCGKIQTQDQLDKYINQYANGNNNIAMPGNLRLGDNMYEDVNQDGKLTEADYVYLGTDDPKVSFSLMPDYRGKASMSRLFSKEPVNAQYGVVAKIIKRKE